MTVVLLSYQEAIWKISDFGFTTEGTSQAAYSTRSQRGTMGYYAPEILLSNKFTMKSDIFSLGCILYELVKGEAAFPGNMIFAYPFNQRKPDISGVSEQINERAKSYGEQLLFAMLEFHWWQRPSAREVLGVLEKLAEDATRVFVVRGVMKSWCEHQYLSKDSGRWKNVIWRQSWYYPIQQS